jgi:transposase
MTIVAHAHPFVIGVDTHTRTHTLAVLVAATGELVATEQFPATDAGMDRAVAWAARRTDGELTTLWVIEGIATYGAHLASAVNRAGFEVVEAARMDARSHRGTGKSDPLDARRIAAAVLSLEPEQLRRPRSDDGMRAALQVLVTARAHMTAERTATVNALTALLRVAAPGIDARKPLTTSQIGEVARWRARVEDLATITARAEAVRLAKRVVDLNEELTANQVQMIDLIRASKAAVLLEKTGIGPVTVAVVYTAWSHAGRVRSEAAFAALAGVNRSPPPQETPLGTDSTAVATGGSTVPCTRPSSPA